MPELVALDLPGGPAFADALRAAWDEGNAVLPIDRRLPGPAVERLLVALRPTVVVDREGTRPLRDGIPTEPGDALVVATSGTTGEPKGVVLDHGGGAGLGAGHLGPSRGGPGPDHWVACLPLAHIGGLRW